MIDAHNHLDFDAFDADRASVVAEARANGIVASVISGTHPATWGRTLAIAASTGDCAVVGVHPAWADQITDWDAVGEALRREVRAGIGEIGLDRRVEPSFDWQQMGLRTQLAVARELDVPAVFHCVGAYPELLAIVRRDGLPAAGGMIHGWSGPPDRVVEALDLGLCLSFGPAVTRPRAPRQHASVRAVPLDRMLVETDCPDQTPTRFAPRTAGVAAKSSFESRKAVVTASSRRGTPADLVDVVKAVGRIRGLPPEQIARTTHANAARLFDLRSPP